MCMFPDEMTSKKVSFEGPPGREAVSGDSQCRACSRNGDQEELQKILLERQCISSSDDCRYSNSRRLPCAVVRIGYCAPR